MTTTTATTSTATTAAGPRRHSTGSPHDARAAFATTVASTAAERSAWLTAVADALDGAADELIPLADEESHLGTARLTGELARTTAQLRLFAEAVRRGLVPRGDGRPPEPVDHDPPRPDLRRMLRPLGPVAVFSASNFPFAFSVAGGDTASALAAGCPVIVKGHSAHPRLSRRTAEVVADALAGAGAPAGVFGHVEGRETGVALVQHPEVRAVGFTGSLHGGRALFDLASSRPDPDPVLRRAQRGEPRADHRRRARRARRRARERPRRVVHARRRAVLHQPGRRVRARRAPASRSALRRAVGQTGRRAHAHRRHRRGLRATASPGSPRTTASRSSPASRRSSPAPDRLSCCRRRPRPCSPTPERCSPSASARRRSSSSTTTSTTRSRRSARSAAASPRPCTPSPARTWPTSSPCSPRSPVACSSRAGRPASP